MTGGPRLGAFGALWFFYFAAIGAFNPYAPLWFKELGFSTLAIGTLSSLQAWTRVVAPFAWGWLGDHGGRRVRLVQLACAVSLLASLGLLWARGYAAVAVFTVVLFLANGGVVPLTEAALARHLTRPSPPARAGNGSPPPDDAVPGRGAEIDAGRYGRIRVWGSVGFIAAVLLFGVALDWAGIGVLPWLVVATWAALLVAAMRLPGAGDSAPARARTPPLLGVLATPTVAWFFASMFFTVLAHTALYAFFSLYLDARGSPKSAVGLLWAVSVAAEIAFFWWQGRFFGLISPHAWLQWAAALSALRFGLIAAAGDQFAVLVGAQLLHAVTFAGHHAACITLINRHFPGALRGRGQALYSVLGYGLSGVAGGVAGGWLSSRAGFEAVFWAAAACALVGWWCATRSHRAAAGAGAITDTDPASRR